MATRGAMAAMDSEARNRIRLATGRLVKRLGIPEPAEPTYERNPQLAQIRELEAHANFLESLDGAIKGEGYSAAPGESMADQADDATEPEPEPEPAKATAKKGKA